MPEVFSRRRRLTLQVALIAAVLVHSLALGGLIWFSSRSDASKALAVPDLHWISMVAPAERPESLRSAASEINPGSLKDPVELAVAVAGPVIEAATGQGMAHFKEPITAAITEQSAEPIMEKITEPITEQIAEPITMAMNGFPKELVIAKAPGVVPPAVSLPIHSESSRSESTHSASPHPLDSLAHPEPLHRVQAALPEPGRRAFDVYLGDFSLGQRVAAMDYLFESDGGHYRLRTEGRATGLMAMLYGGMLTQDSRGRVGPEGFLPERYAERRGERPARVVSFDRTTGLAEADDGSTQPLQAGVQDQLSAIWQLALIARMTPAELALGHELHWPIARGRRVHPMRIVSLGQETLQPSHGAPLRTLHLTLTSATAPDDGRLDVWLATDDAMQPIRMKMASAQGLVLDQIFRFPKHH